MNRLIICVLTLLCGMAVQAAVQVQEQDKALEQAQAQEKTRAAIVFAATEHDFGRIDERGKPVSHTFEFTNEGEAPLLITRVVTSCKCTSAEATKKPVPPGGKGFVKITYNPRKQSGQVYRAIQVLTSQGRAVITIKGSVESEVEN